MTTIAFDGASVCADTLITAGSERVGYQSKILRWGNVIAAYAGDVAACHVALDWLKKGAKNRTRPKWEFDTEFEVLVIRDREVLVLNETFHLRPAYTPYTNGSGGSYAMAALHLGKTSREAVELACKLDTMSGGEIHEEFI